MKISSPAFQEGGTIPEKFSKNGQNVNPELRIEGVPAQAGFGKFDDMLVAIGEGAIDQIILVVFARLDVLGHGCAAAKARIEPAPGLPRVA